MNSPKSPQINLSCELRNIVTNRNALNIKSRMKVLHALNEDEQNSVLEHERRMRLQAIEEILTTEITYLQHLEILMQFFLDPIIEKKLLNHVLLNTLSENVKTLYNVSGELIKELKKNCENVAGAFHKLAPFFKLYSVYAYDYEQISTLLEIIQEKDPTFKSFINSQETRPEVGRTLSSLLITPIQRVPRYKLLLREVLRHTPKRHKEYILLQACLAEIEKAAIHINDLIAQQEDIQKLLMLQKCIVNPISLIKPGRKLIKQGSLMRVSRSGDTAYRRYFVLLSDTLLYCKGKPENSLTIRCVLPLNKCKVDSVLSAGLFRVTCLDEMLLLYSEEGDSNCWIESLQNAIRKYVECRQTLRKDSSSRKPLRHNNVNLFPCDDISEKYGKRKRSEGNKEIQLNPSKIMYFKEDKETEQQDNCFQIFKKAKRVKSYGNSTKTDVETCNALEISNRDSLNLSKFYFSFSESIRYTPITLSTIRDFFSYIKSSVERFFNFV